MQKNTDNSSVPQHGRHELEAARKRLETAKSQETTALNMLEMARTTKDAAASMAKKAEGMKKTANEMMNAALAANKTAELMESAATNNMNAAISQSERSTNEVAAAKQFLGEAEKRWGVIEIDDDEDEALPNTNDKKRKWL